MNGAMSDDGAKLAGKSILGASSLRKVQVSLCACVYLLPQTPVLHAR